MNLTGDLFTYPTSRSVVNSPAEKPRQETEIMRLHGQRTTTPRAEDETGMSSWPEARPVTATARTESLTPEAKRDLGMARVQRAADDAVANWTERAATYLRDYSRSTHGQPFLIEDALEVSRLPSPPNAKAWGPAAQLAARRGWIVTAGYARARTSNRSPKTLWRAA